MSDKFELSRRKALLGLGTVGVAGAGAGVGTSALYSDDESFENNSITAGTLNLAVEGQVIYTGDNPNESPDTSVTSVDGDPESGDLAAVVELGDVKPGDCYIVQTDEIIEGNPAYLQNSITVTSSSENGYTEPEPEDNNDEGELEENIDVSLYYGGNNAGGSSSLASVSTPDDLPDSQGGGVPSLMVDDSQTLAEASANGLAPAADAEPGDAQITDEFVPSDSYGTDGPSGESALVLDPGTWRKFWLFCVPTDVGNQIQGDSVTFDISFTVEQARNNSSPFDGSP